VARLAEALTGAGLTVWWDTAIQTRLEQSSENMSRTFGCKPLIVFEWVLDSEKV
jgi:hypothetical protein